MESNNRVPRGACQRGATWAEAERLQVIDVNWRRRRAASALARPVKTLEDEDRDAIRTLAASLHELGEIRRDLGRVDCVPAYEEALELVERIGDRPVTATCAFNLGQSFMVLPACRDLDQAERWCLKSLGFFDESDRWGLGICLLQLGSIAEERFREVQAAGRNEEELLGYFNEAVRLSHEALDLLPADAVNELAVAHNQLGRIYREAGNLDRAVQHYREAVQRFEQAGDLYRAARTRTNVALAFFEGDRRADALEYTEAALRGFEPYGAGAAEDIEDTRRLIAAIRGA